METLFAPQAGRAGGHRKSVMCRLTKRSLVYIEHKHKHQKNKDHL